MGLLADLWTRFKALLPDWLLYFLGLVIDFIDNLVLELDKGISWLEGQWLNFTSKTLPELGKAIQDLSNDFVSFVENGATVFVETVENTYNYITQEIHNTYHTTEQYITQVIGADQDWVENTFGVNFRKGIEEWVETYIVSAFSNLIGAWIEGILNSIAEGAEEWFRELEEAEGHG